MDILKLIEGTEKADCSGKQKSGTRRDALTDLCHYGKKMVTAALPLGFAVIPQAATAQTSDNTATDALNLLLAIEYLQYEFYHHALTNATIIPATAMPAITIVRDQQLAHINFLIKTITQLGGTPIPPMPYAGFEYRVITTRNVTTGVPTAWAFSATVMTDYKIFLQVACTLETLSTRAYKGQLQSLDSRPDLLAAIAQLHTVEARHSAAIRMLLVDAGITTPANLAYLRPWVGHRRDANGFVGANAVPIALVSNDSGIGALNIFYDRDNATLNNSELKTIQAGIETTLINGLTEVTLPYAAESFDEYVLTPYAKTLFNSFVTLKVNFLT